MRILPLLLAAGVLIPLAGCDKKADTVAASGGPVANVPPPAGKTWTDVVSATPEGGMRMGNPDAPVKLVEYGSFTCPHCMRFEADAAEGLKRDFISSGRVSWEFRSFLLHAQDPAVTLLMNCRGPAPFFPLMQQVFATQDQWLGKFLAAPQEELQRLQTLPVMDQFRKTAELTGLYGFMAARGLPKTQADTCLSDQAAIDKLTAHQDRAVNQEQVNGTPSFFINGQAQADIAEWSKLEPRLRAAVG